MREPSPDQSSRLAAREAGLRYATDEVPGFSRRRRGKGFSYLDRDGNVIRDPEVVDADPLDRDPARLDRRLDLPLAERPPAGDRPRRTRAQAASLPPGVPGRAGRGEVRAARRVRHGAAADPEARRPRPRPPRRPPREGPRGGRATAGADAHPRRQRRVLAAEPVLRPDDAPRPARQGRGHADPLPLPGQGRRAPRGRPARPAPRGADPALPGSARPGPVPVRRGRDGPQRVERRRQRVPARGLGWRFHRQGLPDLGRDGAGLPRAVRAARGHRRADREAERGRGGQADGGGAAQHRGRLTPGLHPPGSAPGVRRRPARSRGPRRPAARRSRRSWSSCANDSRWTPDGAGRGRKVADRRPRLRCRADRPVAQATMRSEERRSPS